MSQFGGGANPFGAPSGMGGTNPYEQPQQSSYNYDQTGGYGQTTGYGQETNYGQESTGYGQSMGPGGAVPGQPPFVARPRVDVDAEGEVDPTLYPEPKEGTHKIRGHSDIIEMLFGPTEYELIPVKGFYFFFYAAFGSLFPLMGVYFKQMGMNPGQCGILIGMRPFVEFLSAPFWGSYADRCRRGKFLLLGSLACWILFTIPLSFIKPEPVKCLERNQTKFVLTYTRTKRDLSAFNVSDLRDDSEELLDNHTALIGINTMPLGEPEEESHRRRKRSLIPHIDAGISPIHINFVSNYDEKQHSDYVTPIFSSMVYRTPDIQKAFFLLLLVILIGEFFSAPAVTLADSAVITLLGDDADKYGHQRMFGSLGWGISMFIVGIVLDHSTSFSHHPCGAGHMEKNYNVCFAIFTVLMTGAIICASKITFKYDPIELEPQSTEDVIDPNKKAEEESMNQLAAQLNLPSLAVGAGSAGPTSVSGGFLGGGTGGPKPQIGAESKLFAQTTKELPEWMTVFTYFKDIKTASFLFVAWYMGFGIGLIFTFLFWHLQDFGGSPTLFGVASVINHVSEIFAYFFSFRLITQIGHVKVLCLGLIGNVLRFLYISYISNPWMVLPFELMQGITHAAVWAASCSYIAHNTPKHLRASAQGVLQGIHHGLGRGCGAIIGGMFVTYYGTTNTFRWYGICCLFVLGLFIFVNFYRKEQGFISDIPVTEDPHQVAEETSHLAPHGVPSNPIPRALSNTRLNEMNPNGSTGNTYGTYQTSGGNLDIPGGSNPFGTQ